MVNPSNHFSWKDNRGWNNLGWRLLLACYTSLRKTVWVHQGHKKRCHLLPGFKEMQHVKADVASSSSHCTNPSTNFWKNAKNNCIHTFLKNKNDKKIHMKLHGLTASEYKWLFCYCHSQPKLSWLIFTALQQQLHNLHQNDTERDIERNWRQMNRTGCCAVAIYNQQLTVESGAGWKSPNCCLIANSTTATPCKYTTLTEL